LTGLDVVQWGLLAHQLGDQNYYFIFYMVGFGRKVVFYSQQYSIHSTYTGDSYNNLGEYYGEWPVGGAIFLLEEYKYCGVAF
jgi:hypothetical protein